MDTTTSLVVMMAGLSWFMTRNCQLANWMSFELTAIGNESRDRRLMLRPARLRASTMTLQRRMAVVVGAASARRSEERARMRIRQA
jgi:hypothetical protein